MSGDEKGKELPKKVNPLNIRSAEQFKDTVAMAETGKESGCSSWCNRKDQKSPVVLEAELWEVRQEHPDYKKRGANRWFIIAKRHASLEELTPEEGADLLLVKQRVKKQFDIKGCFINRTGPEAHMSASLDDTHYYEIAVQTTLDAPYKETLVKNLTGDNLKRLEERAASFTKGA